MSNRAWVTLATNDSYGLGALVLAHSLRRVNSVYPAVILVTPSVTEAMRNRLSAVFAEVIAVDVLDSRDATHLALLQRPELGITFTKIHCWNLTQFEKCVFLDADTLVVQNCDELFEREELSAAPDVGWPDCFNSGVFVFVPSSDTFTRLIAFAQERGSFDGGDQGLLNAFFSDWAQGDINKHLPFLYNVTSAAFYSYLPALKHYGQNMKIIHFIGATKPWLQRFNWESRTIDAPDHLRELLQQWWDIFVGQVHANLDSTMVPTKTKVEDPEKEVPPEVPPHDLQYHYEAKIDTQSEFPWHHPEAQESDQKNEAPILDTSRFYDPWINYKSNFPASKDYSINEYKHSPINAPDIQDQSHFIKQSNQYYYYADNFLQKYDNNKQVNESNQEQSQNTLSQNDHENHREDTKADFRTQYYYYADQSLQQYDHIKQVNQEKSRNTFSKNDHENHREHTKPFPYYDHNHNKHTQHDYHTQNHKTYPEQHREEKTYEFRDSYSTNQNVEKHPRYINRQKVENVYYLHWDMKRRNRRPRKLNRSKVMTEEQLVTNGHISDTDCEYEDDFRPRHPYDGFYLRHRVTIDSRGRKVCTHELPLTLLPSSSLEKELPGAKSGHLATPGEDEEYLTASECEDQSGVAGNLARVVSGTAGPQSEALDELTRRQGWEAGNIDYLGADSFSNIWAKISQTLNQPSAKQPSPPRKEPSPPKQPSPPKEHLQPEVMKQTEPSEQEVVESSPAPALALSETAAPIVALPAMATPALAQPSTPLSTAPKPAEESKSAPNVASTPEVQKEKTEPTVPPTPPATPKSSPESSTPVTEALPKLDVTSASPKAVEVPTTEEAPKPDEAPKMGKAPPVAEASKGDEATPASPVVPEAAKEGTTPVKLDSSVATTTSTDSPPLANTPSKDEAPTSPAAKLEERRRPVEKLQLRPPVAADPLPTPDSEVEDAATLAQSIIASELKVTSPSPSAEPKSPPLPLEHKNLNVQQPEVPTPPVSLAQIGVKPKVKPSTAAQIESSVLGKTEVSAPATPSTPTSSPATPGTPTSPTTPEPNTPTETCGKKKVVKKVVKKEGDPGADASTPVPPPRKKEKKPKDK